MQRKTRLFTPVICTLMGLCAVLVFITLLFSTTLFLYSAAITLLAFVAVLIMLRGANKKTAKILDEIGQNILETGENGFVDAPMPVIALYDNTEIIWYNNACAQHVFAGEDMRGQNIGDIFPDLDVALTSPWGGHDVVYRDKVYTAYVAVTERGGAPFSVIYLIDDAELKYFTNEYHQTRPSVALIMVDNYEEMVQDYKDSERTQLMSEIENLVERYVSQHEGFFIRIQRDRFLAVIEERGIQAMIAGKFNLLDQVRGLQLGGRMSATLSIGVGREATNLYESESMARQALDMCLGRGGDQVAIKNQSGYEFYGGISKGIEKRTKVKTRIIATALSELIETSGNVVIMGHRFADLDCLGSSVGMLKAVRAMNKPSVICIDRQKNLVQPLLKKLLNNGYSPGDFVTPEEALEKIEKDTLLIVLDTHVPYVLESEAVYRAANHVVVIDHHRKLVGYIDNAVIFYHEPYASSASEMVTELVQYFPVHPQLTKLEAEALLSGIMLDTKNFVLRTGVRTFEAAAYLRRIGADTVEVRKMFASSMESYQQKTSLVANAELYHQCAIAASDYQFDEIKVVAPQAADELMTISGVEASFVIYVHDDVVNVSARSMGSMNVQVVMESLGGGGHHTMAAAQFPGDNIEHIRERVMLAIDEYNASLNQEGA